MGFITLENLQLFFTKIKELFVAKEAGKGLSANDLTNTLKSNYDAAYTHSQSTHAPTTAQVNVLESVKVNGAAQTISGKAVDITVPTKTSQITNDSTFQTSSQVSSSITSALASYSNTTAMNTAIANAVANAGNLKRSIVASLPSVGSADANTIYLVSKGGAGTTDNVYTEYMVINGAWEIIGDTRVDLTGYLKESDLVPVTAAEIDAMFA